MEFFSKAWSWVTGSNIASSLAKVALLGYASKLLAGNTDPANNETAAEPDKGVRLQLDPSTDNQIPVLYGEAYFSGNITDAILSTNYKKMLYCLTLAEGTGELLSTSPDYTGYIFKGVYLNNNRVVFKADGFTVDYTLDSNGNQDISYRDLIKIYFYINGPLQPQGFSGTTPQSYTVMSDSGLPSALRWNSTDNPMTDLMYAIVEVNYNKDKNVTGLPECVFHVDTNMKKPGDVLVDYMISEVYGAGIPASQINLQSFRDLNTYANTGFTYTNTNNQSVTGSITINGLVDTTQSVLDNMKKLAEAANAWISYDTTYGQWQVIINQAGSSIASFTDSNIVGDIAISGTSLTQLNSAADVKYKNTDILDKDDFIKIQIPSGDLYANELGKTIEISLPFTNSQVVAAKVGLVQLKQGRVDKIIKFKTDFSYVDLKAGELIDVTTSVYGFTNKVFRIITVAESFDDDGVLSMDITALEYDADVYTYNITEYAVETDDGILGIGSIGKPNTPTVTKTEQANVPKIVISGVVPSGVVDILEYWITFDTGVSEASRNYIKIGQYSNPTGASLTENATYTYTYSGLQQSDFYVKIRGANSIAVGPYSDPSGLIEYVPIVVADTVSDEPVSIGGQLMSLGLLTLLNNLDKLFGGDTSAGGVVDKVIDGIKTSTGFDPANPGTVAAQIAIKDEGTTKTSSVSSINFVGAAVTVTNSGNDVIVTITGTGGSGGTGTYDPTWDDQDSGACGTSILAAGSVYIPPKSGETTVYSCSSNTKWTTTDPKNSIYPAFDYYNYTYTTGTEAAIKTGPTSGKYYVQYWGLAKHPTSAYQTPTVGKYYKVTGMSPAGLNGTFLCTAGTPGTYSGPAYPMSITLEYPYDVGTITDFAGSISLVTATTSSVNLKNLVIKNTTGSNYTLTITPSWGKVKFSGFYDADDRYSYAPNSISGTADANCNYTGSQSVPLVITGSYYAIQQVLQGRLSWQYTNADGTTSIALPPAYEFSEITYNINVDGSSTTHVETVAYTTFEEKYPRSSC